MKNMIPQINVIEKIEVKGGSKLAIFLMPRVDSSFNKKTHNGCDLRYVPNT